MKIIVIPMYSDEIVLKIGEKLNLQPSDVKRSIERKIISMDEYKGNKYIIFKKKVKHIERGTVLFLDSGDYIVGYPKIRRALTLYPTLKKYFIDKIVIEEKLDGYNVRIGKINNNVIAITRGGRICPFTTKKVFNLLDTAILDDYPDLVLCGEMIGYNNPYVSKYYPEVSHIYSDDNNIVENLGFYIFDIRNKYTNEPFTIDEKLKMLKKYNLPHLEPLDIVDKSDVDRVKEIINSLNEEGREGIVLKDPYMAVEPIKYTTHHTQCNDLKVGFRYMYDLGIDFMFSRIIREGYQSYEFNENEEKIDKRSYEIGKSIVKPMVETIREVAEGKLITEDYEIYLDNEDDLNEFLIYLKKLHIPYIIKNKEYKGNVIYVKIGKVYYSTRDRIKSHLDGSLL